MTTCSITPAPIANPSWWQRAFDVLRAGRSARRGRAGMVPAGGREMSERDYASLAGLSAATLRDIGAPEWLLDRAELSRHLSSRPLDW